MPRVSRQFHPGQVASVQLRFLDLALSLLDGRLDVDQSILRTCRLGLATKTGHITLQTQQIHFRHSATAQQGLVTRNSSEVKLQLDAA